MLRGRGRRKSIFLVTVAMGTILLYTGFKEMDLDEINVQEVLAGQRQPFRQEKRATEGNTAKERISTRLRNLETACKSLKLNASSYGPDRSSHLDHLIVNDEKEIMYCFVPKVACTNFKRVFLSLEGVVDRSSISSLSGYEVHVTFIDRLKLLSDFSAPEQQQRLKKYKKFMIVRDPFERFLSGYKNKFFHPNPINRRHFVGAIERFYSDHPSLKNLIKNETITFSDFIQHSLDRSGVGERLNEHFSPFWKLCHPCHIHYDYIGKYENLEDDVPYIFNELEIDVKFPARADNYSDVWTRQVTHSSYSTVPNSLKRKLWNMLEYDYRMFGYSKPDYVL